MVAASAVAVSIHGDVLSGVVADGRNGGSDGEEGVHLGKVVRFGKGGLQGILKLRG